MRGLNISVAALAVVTGLGASLASAQITIPTVTVGNAGNAADSTGYGAVAYTYNIGTYEVTNAQYAEFLNAKAASDPHGLYNQYMGTVDPDWSVLLGGIARSGSDGSYTYNTITGRESNPVNYVSFWDATRFANWLHNGQGNGDTETGAYTLTAGGISANTITRNAGWQWAVTSEDEWYKAAYHQPASQGGDSDNYWTFPTQSNTITTAQANYANSIGNTSPVGSYAANFYGTFDMGGNVWEWNEAIAPFPDGRGIRGGSFLFASNWLQSDYEGGGYNGTTDEYNDIGFRVSQIPGPGSVALMAIGGLGALRRRRHAGR
jgi:formylglycine-generating enzyme required for sulfatase activity